MELEPHHYGVTVSNLETSLSFYRDTLELEETERFFFDSESFSEFVGAAEVDVSIAFLGGDDFTIELLEYAEPSDTGQAPHPENTQVGASHMCFTVNDLDSVYGRLRPDNEFVSPPQTLKNGATVVYLKDPDGYMVELLEE